MATTLSWEDAKKFAAAGGYSKYGSTDNYLKGITVPAPQPTTQPAASSSNNSYGPPAPGSNSTTPPVPQSNVPAPPQRWNVDADYQTRLNHFGGNQDAAKSEILAVKDIYNNEMKAGASADRLGQIHDWAKQVRSASGISEDDVTYGNGVAKPTNVQPPSTMPGANSTQYPSAPTRSNTDAIAETIRKSYMADLNDQTAAINQALQQALQASELAVGKNKQMLEEQIKSLTEQKIVNDQAAADFQNRRGGFYSGGVNFERGNIARASTQAQENVTRDINQRNADIYGRNALLAQQAAENIQRLQNAAPDRIRELIRQAVNDERQFGLQESALTGIYNGNQILAARNADRQFGLQEQQLSEQQKQNNLDNYWKGVDTYGWSNGPVSSGQALGDMYKGSQTLQSQQFQYQQLRDQIGDEQYKQKFDEDVRRFGLEFAADQAYKSAQISNMNADNARQNAAAARQAGNQQLANLYDIWDRTGEAPAGIPGVTAGTKLAGKQTSTPKASDYKNNPDFAEDIAYIKKNPAQAAQELNTNPEQFINKYGYEGYKEMESYVNSLTKK